MMIRFLPLAALALSLTACGSGPSGPPPELHLACQTIQCECIEQVDSLFTKRKKTEIVWARDGKPGCPANYLLRPAETDFLGRPKS